MRPRIPALVFGLCVLAPAAACAKGNAAKAFEKAVKKGAPTPTIVEAAARLAESLDPKGVQSLVRYGALVEKIDVYIACRDALSQASGKAFAALKKALTSSKRVEQRVLCVDALGISQEPGAVEALGKALDDGAKPVRIAAIRALRKQERREGIPLLYGRLSAVGFDSKDAEAEELYDALYALTGQAYENLSDWQKWYESVGPDYDPKKQGNKGDGVSTLTRKGEGKIFGSVVRSQAFVLCLDISSSMRVIDLPPGETWKDSKGKAHKYKDPDPSGRKPPHPESRFSKAREAFIKFIEGLSERARFAIVVFGDKKDTKAWKPQPVKATKRNKKAAIDYVKKLRWSYATRTDLALEEAFKIQGVDSIYLYSDGIPEKRKGGATVDIPADEILERARTLNRARKLKINCYGMASSKAMREFLRKLAEENDGEYKDLRVR